MGSADHEDRKLTVKELRVPIAIDAAILGAMFLLYGQFQVMQNRVEDLVRSNMPTRVAVAEQTAMHNTEKIDSIIRAMNYQRDRMDEIIDLLREEAKTQNGDR